VAIINFIRTLITREMNLIRIDDDDIITAINVWDAATYASPLKASTVYFRYLMWFSL